MIDRFGKEYTIQTSSPLNIGFPGLCEFSTRQVMTLTLKSTTTQEILPLEQTHMPKESGINTDFEVLHLKYVFFL